MKKIKLLIILVYIFCSTSLASPQKLTLVLDWFMNPDHAPLFVAEEQGYFKEQGLEVSLIGPADSNDPPKLVAANKADLALTYEPDFIDQVEQGLPLITIGTLIDRPLNCLLVKADSSIHRLADLKQKRIGLSSSGMLALMLKVMLQQEGLNLNDVNLINVKYNSLQALLAGKVDAVTGVMRNIEGPELETQGARARLFLPEEHGIPRYAELIFIAQKDSLNNPDKKLALKHFLSALQKALQYLHKHPEESWQAFSKHYPALNNDLNHRSWTETLPYFSKNPNTLSTKEWRAFIQFMRQNDLIHSKRPLSDYIAEIKS